MNRYEESQLRVLEAEGLLRGGDVSAARQRYIEAADLQRALVESLPHERHRTRAVYGFSAATLYFRGHDLDEAERLASELLSQSWVEDHSRTQLRELLSRIWNERDFEAAHCELAARPLSVVLRNGEVRFGLAPTDVVDARIRSVLNLFQRIAAWINHVPAARRPPSIMEEAYQTFASQPIAGSYRIDLHLAQPQQFLLDFPEIESPPPPPDQVLDDFMQFVSRAARDDYDAVQDFVPDEDYRRTFVRLIRNVVPDGTRVGEVEFRRGDEPKEAAVTLYPAHRHSLRQMVRRARPSPTPGTEARATSFSGTLRAVDLDRNLLRLDMKEQKLTFRKAEDIFDDVVGPMLNKLVTITGTYPRRGQRFLATDMEPTVEDEVESV